MKKIFAIMAAALTVFALAACDPENQNTPDNPDNPENPNKPDPGKPEIPTLTLSAANIDVAGIDGDYMAVVDNSAKTIKITLEYADKENAKALSVVFENLPEGFTTEYQKTFNYSDGATQTVTFKYGEEKAAEYVISVSISAADPKFLTILVDSLDAMSGEVRMASAASLSKLRVDFTVDPEGTVVTVDGEEIASGDSLNFTDKLNGVTFTLTLGDVVKTHKVIVITSGIRNARRVWGHYSNPKTVEDNWFQTQATDVSNSDHWIRTAAVDNNYVYLAQHKNTHGAYVLSIEDGSIVGRLSTEGIEGGAHPTWCIRGIPDGDGGYKILQCNLVGGNTGNKDNLKVYKWDGKDDKPSVALSYANVDGLRLGDKMGTYGTWKDGLLTFIATTGSPRKMYVFKITNGNIDATPTVVTLGDFGGASYGQAYWYNDKEVLVSICGSSTNGLPTVFSVSEMSFTKTFTADSNILSSTDQGWNFFTFNDQKYAAYMHLESGLVDGSLRIIPLAGETLKEGLEAFDGKKPFKYGIGDPNECPINSNAIGNSVADCVVREIGGETYICAVVADVGVSFFQLEK